MLQNCSRKKVFPNCEYQIDLLKYIFSGNYFGFHVDESFPVFSMMKSSLMWPFLKHFGDNLAISVETIVLAAIGDCY